MQWLLSIFVSLLSGMTGLLLAGVIANACVSWYQISSREGQSGYFMILVALAGGVAGFILGIVVSRTIAACFGSGFGKEFMGSQGAVLLVVGVSALLCRMLADIPPTIDGQELNLEVEFRFPDTVEPEKPPTVEGNWQFMLSSFSGQTRRAYRYGTIQTQSARFENGRWIVPASVELFTSRGGRAVAIFSAEAKEVMSFMLTLPGSPGVEFEKWSEWTPKQQADGQAWPSDKMSCRFRVQKIAASLDSVQ